MAPPIPAGSFPPAPAPRGAGLTVALLVPAMVLGLAGLLAASLLPFLAEPIEYRVGGGVLELRGGPPFLDGRTTVDLAAIREIRDVHLGRATGRMGESSPHRCIGRFTYPDLGTVRQATDCSRDVVLLDVAGGTPVLVNPEEPVAFRAALASGGPATFRPPHREAGGFEQAGPAPLLALAAFIVGAGAIWVVARGPRRLGYEVVGGSLVVHTALATKRFPLADRTARRTGVRARLRLAGSGMPGYHTGWFLLDTGFARVYASRFDDGVLLEGKPRIFVSPADPEALLAALRTRGVRDAR